MNVVVVGLEHSDGQMTVKEGGVIVHAAADRQVRAPGERIVVGTVHARPADKSMHKRRDVSGRVAGDQTAREGEETVIVPFSPTLPVEFPLPHS